MALTKLQGLGAYLPRMEQRGYGQEESEATEAAEAYILLGSALLS